MLQELLSKTTAQREEAAKFTLESDNELARHDGSTRDNYGSAEYWEERYAKEDTLFDWLLGWKELGPVLTPRIDQSAKIMHIGCGNSTMGMDLHESGYGRTKSIVNTDIAPTVIDQMKKRYTTEGLEWVVDDATAMQFADASFDVLIDKGTMDALYCSLELTEKVALVRKMTKEYMRVVRPGGWVYIISFGQPETRLALLQGEGVEWAQVQTEQIKVEGKPVHHLYALQKKEGAEGV
jgi:2-polyprenyl-3-methyl-5-hydroxy-6-metoxy-1,4-benzoquinol methylase